MQHRDPGSDCKDTILLRTIRRASLDAFWGRESSTVAANRNGVMKLYKVSLDLGLKNIFPAMGPFSLEDNLGMGIATCLLRRSLERGKYRETLQFETVRKLRSAYSNLWHASQATLTTSVMARDVRKTYVTTCPTYSLWYERFMLGMHKRMGDEVRQDLAISLDVIHKMVEGLEEEYEVAKTADEKEKVADILVFVLAAFLAGLRGGEVTKLILGEVRNVFEEARYHHKCPHVVLPLRGRFKGETGETYHMIAVSAETDSGLKIGKWVKIGLELKERRGLVRGYYFTDRKGRKLEAGELEPDVLDRIERVQTRYPELIRTSIDVHEEYGVSRSFRRGSNSEAQNRGVSEADIERNNRWRKVDRAGARKVKLRMRDHYTDILVALESFLRYSQAL